MLDNRRPITPIAIVQSDTTVYDPPLDGLVICAAGTVKIMNWLGDPVTITLPAAVTDQTITAVPFTLPGKIRMVYDTDTSIADAALIGLR